MLENLLRELHPKNDYDRVMPAFYEHATILEETKCMGWWVVGGVKSIIRGVGVGGSLGLVASVATDGNYGRDIILGAAWGMSFDFTIYAWRFAYYRIKYDIVSKFRKKKKIPLKFFTPY